MGTIYGLYPTDNGHVAYVGKTWNTDKRWKRHRRIARCGDMSVGRQWVHHWIGNVWLHGFDVKMTILETGIEEAKLAARERFWMQQFPDLRNTQQRKVAPEKATHLGWEVNESLAKEVRKVRYNADGFHGIEYVHEYDKYRVAIASQGCHGVSRFRVRGDELPGVASSPVWFSDLRAAIDERDRERRSGWRSGWQMWPRDVLAELD